MADDKPSKIEKSQQELDEFLSQLKPTKYKDGWPEDRWEEEMEKHPIFTSKPIEEGQDLPPLVEAMQQLKYDPDMNTPDELALSYKEDGNVNFKRKKYRWAVESYTQGLKANSTNDDLNSQLFTNRAAAHFHIGNFEKALKDVKEAKLLNAKYVKAIHRGALCCWELGQYEDCISWCNDGLEIEENNSSLIELRKKAIEKKKIIERNKRRESASETKNKLERDKVLSAIKERGINLAPSKKKETQNSKVYLHIDDKLIWPVLLLYPEHSVTDFIQNFHEDSCLLDHLKNMFNPDNRPTWDKENKYEVENLQVYFYVREGGLVAVDKLTPLKSVLSDKRYQVHEEQPCFMITVKNSPFDKTFRKKTGVLTK